MWFFFVSMLDSRFDYVESVELLGNLQISLKYKDFNMPDLYTIDLEKVEVIRKGSPKNDFGSVVVYDVFLEQNFPLWTLALGILLVIVLFIFKVKSKR